MVTLDNSLIGKYLYSTCAAEVFGQIVGVDAQTNTADIYIFKFTEVITSALEDLEYENTYDAINAKYGCRPCIAKSIKVDDCSFERPSQYSDCVGAISLDTPWDGCYRCVSSFWLQYVWKDAPAIDPNASTYEMLIVEVNNIMLLV